MLWIRVISWLRITQNMNSLNSAPRQLNNNKKGSQPRIRRVFLGLIVYLLCEERNKSVFKTLLNLLTQYSINFRSSFTQLFSSMEKTTQLTMLLNEVYYIVWIVIFSGMLDARVLVVGSLFQGLMSMSLEELSICLVKMQFEFVLLVRG